MDPFPLGYNTYSVRAMRWHDLQLLEYAASLKLDAIYNGPITSRPPQILAVYDPEFMKTWRDMRASDLARFIALAKRGHPYAEAMVVEDVPGKMAEPIAAALQYPQRDHMQKGVEYARQVLDLGIRWRA